MAPHKIAWWCGERKQQYPLDMMPVICPGCHAKAVTASDVERLGSPTVGFKCGVNQGPDYPERCGRCNIKEVVNAVDGTGS